jgi:hypothetical protein
MNHNGDGCITAEKNTTVDLKEGMTVCAGLNWLRHVLKARSFERTIS